MINAINSSNSYMSYLQQTQSANKPSGPPDLFSSTDTDDSGGISQSELDTWAKDMSKVTGKTIDTTNAVSTYDTDGDGVLNSTELKSFLGANGIKLHSGRHHNLFSKIDADDSGGISQSELDTWAKDMSQKTGKAIDTTNAISTYDTDGDGVLSPTELKPFLDASGIRPPSGGPQGVDHAENISASTMANASTGSVGSIISSYDADGDGLLSSSELQAFLDDSANTSANSSSSIQQALSAYLTNLGESMSDGSSASYFNDINLAIDFSA